VTTQSRRDLYQAHKLMMQRACLALLRGEPDVPDQPLRRLNVAVFSSALVTVIVASLAVIWALLGHGGAPITQRQGALVIDRQTGTSYVFCQGNKLCPAVNYASARLALASSSVNQQVVNQSALTGYARGPLIGIPGLPQPLPVAGLLIRQPWSVCVQTSVTLAGSRTVTTLTGGIATGGQPSGDSALLVKGGGKDWVIWDGQRMLISPDMLQALPTTQPPVTVSGVWLDALPRGPGFDPPAIPGKGRHVTGPAGGTAAVGQVYRVNAPGGGTRYYVLLRDGDLAAISQTQAALLEFSPGEQRPKTLAPSQVTGHVAGTLPGHGLPASVPQVAAVSAPAPLCVSYAGGGRRLAMQVTVGGRVPSGGVATGGSAGVDEIVLPPGRGALVGATPQAGQGGAVTYFLVSGGRRYALASQDVAAMLGYDLPKQSVLLPAGVVDLIPQGPALDPAAAARPVAAAQP
jgi:type VII secretion protein EccB